MNENILIAGATGQTGRIIVNKLLNRGFRPRILVRNEPAAKALFGDKVDIFLGDVREIESLQPAMAHVHTIISAIGTRTPVGKNCPKRVDYEGVANLVDAAKSAGIARFILISSIAVTHANHPLNRFGRILEWKLKGEETLRESGLDYAIIRPGGLIDTPGGQKCLIVGQGDQMMGTISRSDVAETCLCALDYPGKMRLTFEVIETQEDCRQNWQEIFASLEKDANPLISLNSESQV